MENNNQIDRKTVLGQAIDNCMREMYRKSQPSADFDEYARKLENGEIKEEPGDEIYRRHYLSMEEYSYIVDKYVTAYGMEDNWNNIFEILVEYLGERGMIEHGDNFEHLPDIEDVFKDILNHGKAEGMTNDAIAERLKKEVLGRIENCRKFFRHGAEENDFRITMALYCGSPTSNKDEVKKYWAKKGIDIEIVDRDPDKFWENDYYEELNE